MAALLAAGHGQPTSQKPIRIPKASIIKPPPAEKKLYRLMPTRNLRKKMNNNNNNNRPSPAVRPSNNRTEVTAAPTTQSYMEPVVDYNNKCVDESLMYSAVGVLGSSFV